MRQKLINGITRLGLFLMKGRREAAIAAMLTAAIPFLGWASLAIVCFVTLRKGMKEGLFVSFWAVIPAVISSYIMGSGALALESLFAYILLWGLSGLLRSSASWRYVLEVSAGIAIGIVVYFHWQIPNLNEIYVNYLMDVYQNSGAEPTTYPEMQSYIQYFVYYLLGIQTTLYMIHNILCLLIARGVQAILYNPKGLCRELKMIRLGWFFWILAAVFLFLGLQKSFTWALDTFPVFIALFFFSGLSLLHYWVNAKIKIRGIMFIIYILLLLLLPFSFAPIILLALFDTGWNLRKFFM